MSRTNIWNRNLCLSLAIASMVLAGAGIVFGTPVKPLAVSQQEADIELSEDTSDLLQQLDDNREQLGQNAWAKSMQQLILLGRPATKLLTHELDVTSDQYRIRCIVFALRGIGDKSAIPALIRAIPKTLQPPLSDYGLRCDNPVLMKFMQEHDTDHDERDLHFSFGRPISEVSRTLKQWTAQDLGYSEIVFVHREGGAPQQAQQERLYMAVAVRFADWWREHWQEYVDDPALSVVNLPAPRRFAAALGIPTGASVEESGGHSGILASALERDHQLPERFPKDWTPPTLTDLDTGRNLRWPASLPPPEQMAGHEARLAAWAAHNGIDLMGTQYQPPDSDKTYYVLQPFGLRAWQLSDEELTNIVGTLRNDSLKLGPPIDGFLAHYDRDTQQFRPEQPCSFLFVTREGTCGTIRIVSQVTKRVAIGGPAGEDDERGLYNGVRTNIHFLYIPPVETDPSTR